MTRNITDKDIVAALNGSATSRSATRDVVEALHGGKSPVERSLEAATVAALTGRPAPRSATEGELPLQRRGDDLEAVAIWASTEASASATSALAQALMRADANKGIYAAESEAKAIAAEAYGEAAKSSAFEDVRQEHVKKFVTKLAESLTPKRQQEALGARKNVTATSTSTVAEAGPGKRKVVTISMMTGQPITHYV